ncbi:MAG: flagellar FlbD family protein [Fibrobacterota bacterium]
MIVLHRLNGKEFVLNADFIESVEKTPDTVIKLTNGKVFMVADSPEDVIEKCMEYKKNCGGMLRVVHSSGGETK